MCTGPTAAHARMIDTRPPPPIATFSALYWVARPRR